MAKVKYMSLVKEVRDRLGDVVFSQWKQTPYVRAYVKRGEEEISEGQREVRASLTRLVADWKGLNGSMHRGWDLRARSRNMTGFNAFIGANLRRQRQGEALELFVSTGLDGLVSFSASGGAKAGEIVVEFSPRPAGGGHLTILAQRRFDGKAAGPFSVHDAGGDAVSPVTLAGLDPGSGYFVYGVVTDASYAGALAASASLSAVCTARE